MEHITKFITNEIKLSSLRDKYFKTEVTLEEHVLVFIFSGETKLIQADASYLFTSGDVFLIPRNQLTTVLNYPKDGLPHRAVAIHLSTERLKRIYQDITPAEPVKKVEILSYKNHPLLDSYLASLLPYFDMKDTIPENIASLKIQEAISILRVIDKSIDIVLANFEEPWKIPLTEFMEKNFMFNMPLEKISYLTGRSLSTFKRDFKKLFNTTPQKWLTKKRLELAHYNLVQNKKPTDVYFEVGFENLSHFSFAFKKQYGYSPTQLQSNSARK
ncbi:helix-turn-helix domain-containing protein [Emticicia sp. 17c]|uniref:helix-turn-helix domain-containing protein n=1 Tax=Emticicia sp. 17c TaxID=3127704 RepID=UPI00301DA52B